MGTTFFKILFFGAIGAVGVCAFYSCVDHSWKTNDEIHERRKASPVWR